MSNLQVAKTIIEQMGGFGKLRAMIGFHTAVGSDTAVTFMFRGCRTANKCRVTLNVLDLYDMEIYKLSRNGLDIKEVYAETNLYFDMLIPQFEQATGLTLSL